MPAAVAGLQEAGGLDARASGCFIGTSAGSVVGAGLASGVAPRDRLEQLAREPARARTPSAGAPSAVAQALALAGSLGRAATAAAAAPAIALGLRVSEPAGAVFPRPAPPPLPAGGRARCQLGSALPPPGPLSGCAVLVAALDSRSL